MADEVIRIDSVEVVHRIDNVWVHFHLASGLPRSAAGTTFTVEASARDGSSKLVGVTLHHPDLSELFVSGDAEARTVVSVGTEHIRAGVLTVAFPADVFSHLGADPVFVVRLESGSATSTVDVPVTVTDPPLTD